MDIADIVSEEYVEFTPEATVSKLVGTFADSTVKGVVIRDDEFEGSSPGDNSRPRIANPTKSSDRSSGTCRGSRRTRTFARWHSS